MRLSRRTSTGRDLAFSCRLVRFCVVNGCGIDARRNTGLRFDISSDPIVSPYCQTGRHCQICSHAQALVSVLIGVDDVSSMSGSPFEQNVQASVLVGMSNTDHGHERIVHVTFAPAGVRAVPIDALQNSNVRSCNEEALAVAWVAAPRLASMQCHHLLQERARHQSRF